MKYLRKLSIQTRLWMQLGIMVIGIAVLMYESLSQLDDALLDEKSAHTKLLVDVAHSVLVTYHQQELSGQLSRKEAQAAAIEAIKTLRYDKNNYFWIQDMHPRMIMHPIKPTLNGKDLSQSQDPTGKNLFIEMVETVKANGEGQVHYMWPYPGQKDPVDKISHVEGFKPWGWIVGSGVYLLDVEEVFWSIAPIQLITGAIIIAILALAFLLIGRSISIPLSITRRALDNIAAGDGDLSLRLDDRGRDEVADMAKSFNAFVGKIDSTLQQVNHATAQLGGASDDLKTAMQSTQQVMAQQQDESQNIATAVNQMATTVNKIASSAEGAVASAGEATEEAKQGNQIVAQASDSVGQLAQEVQQANTVIQNLNADTLSISSVLEVIRDIAEQTNLLALNAAIEAARAGETGRGFAVVADEVRTLAARTQASTDEIRNSIESLQSGSQKAVKAMENGEKTTEITVGKAIQASSSIDKITTGINSILTMNQDIASAAEQQASAAQEIDQSVDAMAQLTSQTYQEIEKTALSSNELSALSQSLKKLVGQFKLSQ